MTIEIRNRLQHGLVIGWSYFAPDEDHDWHEVTFYLLVVELYFRW